MTTDRDAGATVQIRDASYAVRTPSLEQGGFEVAADELVRDLLKAEWIASEAAPFPLVVAKDEQIQANMRKQPVIQVEIDDWREEPTGHRHEFAKIEVPMNLEVKSIKSRLECWGCVAEVRRIIYKWFLALKPFHCMYYDGARPEYLGPGNWCVNVRIRLTADCVPVFARRVDGEESPNTDPGSFPEGNI